MLHLTANNFQAEVTDASQPVIVMFYADWCSKCAMMKPVAEDAEKKYRGQIKFCKVNIEESTSLASKYEAAIVPTFVFFENGQIVAAFNGLVDESVFEKRLKKIFRNC